jgi:hypothetical protein
LRVVSAEASQWPGWLRRHTGIEHAGTPRTFFAWTTISLSLFVIAYVGGWNAAKYPIALGYDYNSTAIYMHVVLSDHRIPTQSETLEGRQPPVYYIVGGLAARAGHRLFHWEEAKTTAGGVPENSYRGAQILNVVFVLLTALLLLSLARTVAPRSPPVWAAALAFFAFLPVVAKTEAMIHPEPLNMLLSTTAVWLATNIVRRPSLSRRLLILLVAVLAVGLATRASIIFTAAAIAVALAVRYARHLHPRRLARHAVPLALVVVLVGAVGYWILAGQHSGSLVALGNIGAHASGSRRAFFRIPIKLMFSGPFRTHYVNSAIGETYTEIWGDWIGAFAWSTYQGSPTGTILAVLKDQSWIGFIPTLLAVAGYVALLLTAITRRRDLLALALVPPIAMAGYLLRSYQDFSPDGDLLKASYVLTTAPIWALGFGVAFDRLGRFKLVRLGLTATLMVFAVMELRFMMYGVRVGFPPF